MTEPVRPRRRGNLAEAADLVFPYAVRVAATLRLADFLADGVCELTDLAAAAGAEPDALGRLMRYLTCRGVFAETAPDTYRLTPAARMLCSDSTGNLRALLDLEGLGGRLDRPMAGLLESVRTGSASYPAIFGKPFWDDLAEHPELGQAFDTMMAAQVGDVATEVAQGFSWSEVGHVVDVGGGAGALLTELLRTYPTLTGTLVDLPGPAKAATRVFEEAGLADRCTVVEGSFFAPLPTGGDVYVLSVVLHDWDDRQARAILRSCAHAAGAGGTVLVVEGLADGDLPPAVSTTLDLRMLVTMGGKERTHEQMRTLIESAGLTVVAARRTATRTLLECRTRGPR
ncbi:methyltransferase [Nocardia iowensis]|uniref:Methyltransferase n=1 Tax=Nocardia iowensis TaxID=204891 RepID=A0ABX8RHG5_NOCIO|nr:methyltransferase [Nocardia iowensis]QXN88452.1 methyltransferase [Nocardia iowensis]